MSLALTRSGSLKNVEVRLFLCNPAAAAIGIPDAALKVVAPAPLKAAENSLNVDGGLEGMEYLEMIERRNALYILYCSCIHARVT